jgi:hypothetical protein
VDAARFLSLLREAPTFGAQHFVVQNLGAKHRRLPSTLTIAVNVNAIFFLDKKRWKILYVVPYGNVLETLYNGVRFKLRCKQERGNTTFALKTTQGDQLHHLVADYMAQVC